MTTTERTVKLGQRVELEQRLRDLEIKIDTEVRALKDVFEPRDRDYSYIKDIDTERLAIYTKDIKKHKAEYDKVKRQLEDVKKELGED